MTFTKEQLDDMVRDAQRLADEYSTGFYADEQVQDVALHVKALAAEVDRLQAIVGQNPTWADGTPVTSGSTGYSVDGDECPVRLLATFETQEDAKQRQHFDRWHPTREAAEAARKEKP